MAAGQGLVSCCSKNKSWVSTGYGGEGGVVVGGRDGYNRQDGGGGKVGRVSLNNVALHAAFRECASLFCLDGTDGSLPR